MPWKVSSTMSQRQRFCEEAVQLERGFAALCQRYGISRPTGYKWLKRYRADGVAGLQDRSSRPGSTARRTAATVEEAVVGLRAEHPAWGGRKLAWVLARQGLVDVPHPNTITDILRRHGLLEPRQESVRESYVRFAMAEPNQLWQMDFKGHFELGNGQRCYTLGVLDDHSRYLLALYACGAQTRATVQPLLTTLFRSQGLPDRMLVDHGPPWGYGPELVRRPVYDHYTRFSVWLMRLGITVSHGRVAHPQTQGKQERLNRTLGDELLVRRSFADFADCQSGFDTWRYGYNHHRPHEALGMQVPAACYRPSQKAFPETLPPIVYDEGIHVRNADDSGRFSFMGRVCKAGKAFAGESLGLIPGAVDGCYTVLFGRYRIMELDLK